MNKKIEQINIPIKGFLPSTLIDWPGKMAAILFIFGCNFRCPFCHNPELVLENNEEDLDLENILEFLQKRKKWVDGVVITGGEPTIHQDIFSLAKILKKAGFLVKLDTNGTNPTLLYSLIQGGLVDYIAMDIKGPLSSYEKITKSPQSGKKILKSVSIILESGIDYEFRTTVVPSLLGKEEIREIGKLIEGARIYYLQQFYPTKTLDKDFLKEQPYSYKELLELKNIISPFVKEAKIRGI